MYDRLYRLYHEGKIGEAELTKAVEKGWITAEQKQQIMESNG